MKEKDSKTDNFSMMDMLETLGNDKKKCPQAAHEER